MNKALWVQLLENHDNALRLRRKDSEAFRRQQIEDARRMAEKAGELNLLRKIDRKGRNYDNKR